MIYDISVLPLYVNCSYSPVRGIINKLIRNPTSLKNLEDINQYFPIKMETLNSINEDIPSCRDANVFFREKHMSVIWQKVYYAPPLEFRNHGDQNYVTTKNEIISYKILESKVLFYSKENFFNNFQSYYISEEGLELLWKKYSIMTSRNRKKILPFFFSTGVKEALKGVERSGSEEFKKYHTISSYYDDDEHLGVNRKKKILINKDFVLVLIVDPDDLFNPPEVFLPIDDSIGIRIFSDFFLSIIPKKFIE